MCLVGHCTATIVFFARMMLLRCAVRGAMHVPRCSWNYPFRVTGYAHTATDLKADGVDDATDAAKKETTGGRKRNVPTRGEPAGLPLTVQRPSTVLGARST